MALIEHMIASNFAFDSVIPAMITLINSGNLLVLPVVSSQLVMSAKVAINTIWSVPWKIPFLAVLIYSGGIFLQNILFTLYVPYMLKYFPSGNYSFLLNILYNVPYILHFGSGIMVFGVAVSELCEETEVIKGNFFLTN